ncbi:MAG: hypothetical protein K2Q03_00525 [Sphingobacteriaceae bacterium]|nr:hypothetical protein [Sphingobacteriaceae bacterium]
MKKTVLYMLFFVFAFAYSAQAQTKIGKNSTELNQSAILELESLDKGLLLPRVILLNTTSWSLAGDQQVAGMLVYNINTRAAGFTDSALFPGTLDGSGLYYWNGEGWVVVDTALSSSNNVLSVVNVLSGTNLMTSINGEKSNALNLRALIPVISTQENKLISTVNGVATSATIINSQSLTAKNGLLTQTINGQSATASVLTAAYNGLTQANGEVQLGGKLDFSTSIATDVNKTLAITGLQASTANTDKVVVIDANTGVLKTKPKAKIVIKSTNYTVLEGDETIFITGSGSIFITLPDASLFEGREISFHRSVDSTGSVTIVPENGNIETISTPDVASVLSNSSTMRPAGLYGSRVTYQSNGIIWFIKYIG